MMQKSSYRHNGKRYNKIYDMHNYKYNVTADKCSYTKKVKP